MVADSKHDSCTDQSLILFMATGTSASDAWGVFIDKYGRRLYEWSRQWCANHHDAEELVQETILIVFRKIGVFQRKSEGCFRSWLREISYRCWLEMLKRRKRFERPIYDHQVLDHQRGDRRNVDHLVPAGRWILTLLQSAAAEACVGVVLHHLVHPLDRQQLWPEPAWPGWPPRLRLQTLGR